MNAVTLDQAAEQEFKTAAESANSYKPTQGGLFMRKAGAKYTQGQTQLELLKLPTKSLAVGKPVSVGNTGHFALPLGVKNGAVDANGNLTTTIAAIEVGVFYPNTAAFRKSMAGANPTYAKTEWDNLCRKAGVLPTDSAEQADAKVSAVQCPGYMFV